MILRALTIGSLVLAVTGGAYFAWNRPERAWERRLIELRRLAIPNPGPREPWELAYEALKERLLDSPRFDELTSSDHPAHRAWSEGEPRALDPLEREWLAGMWSELAGLDEILASLRLLPLEEIGRHGTDEPAKMYLTREIANALCGRAWLALEVGDDARALAAWTDALRMARALDEGTTVGTVIRGISEGIVLGNVRASLELGMNASLVRQELLPFYLDCGNVASRAEHAIRRDLSVLGSAESIPARALEACRGVEEALARTREPARAFFEEYERVPYNERLVIVIDYLHRWHAWRNVAFTALAVAAHREQHGRLPATLDEIATLEPELRLDPWTGIDLPYQLASSEARIGPPAAQECASDVFAEWTLR